MASKIYFISDLHFDFTTRYQNYSAKLDNGYETCKCENGNYFIGRKEKIPQKAQVESFLRWIKENVKGNDFLIIAGDSFNKFSKTIDLINKINSLKISGCYVLGNHDYWNDGTLSIDEIEKKFKKSTKNNRYFKTLFSGDYLSYKNIKIIGDCGWTNLSGYSETPDFSFFKNHKLPETKFIKNFDEKTVIGHYNKWKKFAQNFLKTQKTCLVVTHFPMFYIEGDQLSKWFGSKADLNNQFFSIFGHNHKNQFFGNQICNQRGYKIKEFIFNSLTNSNEIISLSDDTILQTYINFPKRIEEFKWNDFGRGYRRVSANRINFEALIKDKQRYTDTIDGIINGYIPRHIDGWNFGTLSLNIENVVESIAAILNANNYLKTHDINDDIVMYLTSAVITGYAYNGMATWVTTMRKLEPNDILRWYLYYANLKINKIDKVFEVRKSKNFISNTSVYFPIVNNKDIPIEYQRQICQNFQLTFGNSLKLLGYKNAPTFSLVVNKSDVDKTHWITISNKDQAKKFKKKIDKLLQKNSWDQITIKLKNKSVKKKYYEICKRYHLKTIKKSKT